MNFKVGDVCVIVNADIHPEHNGRECSVYEGPRIVYPQGSEAYYGYIIDIPGSPSDCKTGRWCARPEHLRLKRPPNKDEFVAGEWELCPFNPYKKREMA